MLHKSCAVSPTSLINEEIFNDPNWCSWQYGIKSDNMYEIIALIKWKISKLSEVDQNPKCMSYLVCFSLEGNTGERRKLEGFFVTSPSPGIQWI